MACQLNLGYMGDMRVEWKASSSGVATATPPSLSSIWDVDLSCGKAQWQAVLIYRIARQGERYILISGIMIYVVCCFDCDEHYLQLCLCGGLSCNDFASWLFTMCLCVVAATCPLLSCVSVECFLYVNEFGFWRCWCIGSLCTALSCVCVVLFTSSWFVFVTIVL